MEHPSGLLTVDLSAVQQNWLRLRAMLAAGAECGAVVKANAYGLGMVPVARALQQVGCQSYFVVNSKEGAVLRSALGNEPTIYLLQGVDPGNEPACVARNLVPVLISYPMARRWLAFCEAHQLPQQKRRSALKINTGMNRLGLGLDELEVLVSEPGCLEQLGCELLISHLACADEMEHPLNEQQLQAFKTALAQVQQQRPNVRASIANSAATLRGDRWHFDLVRPGISLYGSNPTGLPEHQMQPVANLQLPVVQSRVIKAGSSIGYGATYVAADLRHVVAIFGGYGDGIFRCLGNRDKVWFKRMLPIVGRVSMDSIIVDVTDLPEGERPMEGDLVELLGSHVNIDATAEAAGTIAYEVLTRLTGRYSRRYILDGTEVHVPSYDN